LARVALLSGGKDSLYAASKLWPPDLGLVLVYRFPEPSPHLVNLGATLKTLTLTGVPVVVARLPRGREFEETVRVLRLLGASELVAGDVFVEDHLRYMERVASEAGATLREPLWGMDTGELLHEIVEYGIEAVLIGLRGLPRSLLGMKLNRQTVWILEEEARRHGADPLGENGEYHTLVVDSPHHSELLRVGVLRSLRVGSVDLLIVEAEAPGGYLQAFWSP
jgi:diphthine-ammonia ligase